ncbi:unnamed protein product [Cuscuta epithymum]|uniref:PWWP domain-containing protein n=1 Tax=Cuscuta epithymum TaxID=186058 RepID=A0AAV0E2V6_9ASTE|nr:unnamed protein product [Cuscuta epithymum]
MLLRETVMHSSIVGGLLQGSYVGRNNEIDSLMNGDAYRGVGVEEGLLNPTMVRTMDTNAYQFLGDEMVSVHGIGNTGQITAMQPAYIKEGDIKHSALAPRSRQEESKTEEEGEFYVSDLVWGKVRNHPWWPGQIFEPSAASQEAKKHFKSDSYLIAFFGDQSFAWNEVSQIKPYRMYFNQMEKQSCREAFCHAVDCSLDEVSRRIEFGLCCPCVPEEVQYKLKSQIVVNAGIQPGSSHRDGGDQLSTVDSFRPGVFLQHLKSIASSPCCVDDRMGYVVARSQLLAFSRWKGYYELSAFEEFHGLMESDAGTNVTPGLERTDPFLRGDSGFSPGKKKSSIRDTSFLKGNDCEDETDRWVNFLRSDNNSKESDLSELGPSYTCVSTEVQYKSESQIVVCSGFKAESNQRDDSEKLSAMASFRPLVLLQYLKSLALSPRGITDRLGFLAARYQLLEFSHWKGNYELPATYKEFQGLLRFDAGSNIAPGVEGRSAPPFLTGDSCVPSGKEKPTMGDGSSRKRRRLSKNMKGIRGKEELVHGNISSIPDVVKVETDDMIDSICSDTNNNLNESSLILSELKPKRIEELFPTLDNVFLKLSIAAKDPTNGYAILAPLTEFFSGLRDFTSSENSSEHRGGGETLVRECHGVGPSNDGTTESSVVDGVEDSYWTNRIIQGNPEQLVFCTPAAQYEKNDPVSLVDGQLNLEEHVLFDTETQYEKISRDDLHRDADGEAEEDYPTALILTFKSLECVPSAAYLNEMLGQFGPIDEYQTEATHKTKRAKVVFRRRCDAESAFNGAGTFSYFGDSLIGYRLDYAPRLRKVPSSNRGRKKAAIKQ